MFVLEEYKKVGQSDARWYIPEYWFNLFNLDTPLHSILSTMNYASGVYDDIDTIQVFARGYMIIISTNNPRSILEHKLKALECTDHISETFSSVSDFNKIVKNQHFYSQICMKLGVRAEQVLHVGDDPFYDVSEPRAAGFSAILMDRDGENNALHNLYDLLKILKSLA